MTRPTTDHDDGTPTPRKATLFCWECDHSSPVDGDWVVQSRERCVAYVCPECETTLLQRPRQADRSRERPSSEPLAVWEGRFDRRRRVDDGSTRDGRRADGSQPNPRSRR
ncbi:hypothetical protein HTG_03315 [Natrinema mahii]|nr:hypothetical protein HTG_03315 [Natrinema mahii]